MGVFRFIREVCVLVEPRQAWEHRRQSDGGPPIVQAWCNGIATVPLPWASRCPWEWYRSNTVAIPLHYRRTAVEAREDDRLYRRVVSPKNMGRCPDSGVTSCPAGTCGQEARSTDYRSRSGAGSESPFCSDPAPPTEVEYITPQERSASDVYRLELLVDSARFTAGEYSSVSERVENPCPAWRWPACFPALPRIGRHHRSRGCAGRLPRQVGDSRRHSRKEW